ncbi:spermidine synthase [Neolewinella antarctica]|uniref:Spermidine synthase n=1 Tax=Neolewinella antarctica TaxID=442734 RepID=A0ABX0XFW7_9BACT|nr:fused MFS/spermidine synthase [Neolewinella antarctica]NJC28126.1 spermidine synthase [Neolewinella antarctica]
MSTPIPTYRRWLSHLTEQVLETASSEYNKFLQVSLVGGRLQLVAEDAIYSFGDYYMNFRKTFERIEFDLLPERASVLVLGLGLGSIPELLEKHQYLTYDYVAVEIDPVIIELAADYSLPALDSPVEVVQADAFAFLQIDVRTFDLVCVDVFQDATVPAHILTDDFLHLLRESLNPGGLLIYNRLADTPAHREEARLFYDGPFKSVFPDATVVDTGGNLMLVSESRFV